MTGEWGAVSTNHSSPITNHKAGRCDHRFPTGDALRLRQGAGFSVGLVVVPVINFQASAEREFSAVAFPPLAEAMGRFTFEEKFVGQRACAHFHQDIRAGATP
jgi:hypothetical protein